MLSVVVNVNGWREGCVHPGKAREDVSTNLSLKKLRHRIVSGHDILNTRVDIGLYRLRRDVPVLLPKRTGRKWKQARADAVCRTWLSY